MFWRNCILFDINSIQRSKICFEKPNDKVYDDSTTFSQHCEYVYSFCTWTSDHSAAKIPCAVWDHFTGNEKLLRENQSKLWHVWKAYGPSVDPITLQILLSREYIRMFLTMRQKNLLKVGLMYYNSHFRVDGGRCIISMIAESCLFFIVSSLK